MHRMRNKARIVAAPAQHQSLGRILWQQHGRRAVIAANRRNATPALETFLARVELGHTPDIPDEELPRVDDGSHLPSKFEPVGVGLAPTFPTQAKKPAISKEGSETEVMIHQRNCFIDSLSHTIRQLVRAYEDEPGHYQAELLRAVAIKGGLARMNTLRQTSPSRRCSSGGPPSLSPSPM